MKKLVVFVVALSLAFLSAPAHANTSEGLRCKVTSYSFAGSDGTLDFYNYRARIQNNKPAPHRVEVAIQARQNVGGYAYFYDYFHRRVGAASVKLVNRQIEVGAGVPVDYIKVHNCRFADS